MLKWMKGPALAGLAMTLVFPALIASPCAAQTAQQKANAAYIMARPEVTNALKALPPLQNYPWARDILVQSATGAAPAPTPTPPPVVTPDPAPIAAPAGIAIANDAALDAALVKAKGGEVFLLAAGSYSLDVRDKVYSPAITIDGQGKAKFGEWSKLTNVSNVQLLNMDFLQATTGPDSAGDVMLAPNNVDGLTLRNVNFIGLTGGYGYSIWVKTTAKNIKVDGGSCKRFEYCFSFQKTTGVEISNVDASEITADFVQLGGGSSNINVHHNKLHDWKPARGSHSDAMQAVCYSANLTFSFNDVSGAMQGVGQYGSSGTAPCQGTTNWIVEGNTFKISYANNVMLVRSTGKIINNKLLTGAWGYKPLIRVVEGAVSVSGNTVDGKPN